MNIPMFGNNSWKKNY